MAAEKALVQTIWGTLFSALYMNTHTVFLPKEVTAKRGKTKEAKKRKKNSSQEQGSGWGRSGSRSMVLLGTGPRCPGAAMPWVLLPEPQQPLGWLLELVSPCALHSVSRRETQLHPDERERKAS